MPDGIVQGGLLCAIADMSQTFALFSVLDAYEVWPTLDFQAVRRNQAPVLRLQPAEPVRRRRVADVCDRWAADLRRRRHPPPHRHKFGPAVGIANDRSWIVGKYTRHRWQIADIAVDHPEQRDDCGLVGRDGIKIAQGELPPCRALQRHAVILAFSCTALCRIPSLSHLGILIGASNPQAPRVSSKLTDAERHRRARIAEADAWCPRVRQFARAARVF